jgi:hypothetical protein
MLPPGLLKTGLQEQRVELEPLAEQWSQSGHRPNLFNINSNVDRLRHMYTYQAYHRNHQ